MSEREVPRIDAEVNGVRVIEVRGGDAIIPVGQLSATLARPEPPFIYFAPKGSPSHIQPIEMALTRSIVNTAETIAAGRNAPGLSRQELLSICLADTSRTPNPRFTATAINRLNQMTFPADFNTIDLAGYFVGNDAVQRALAQTIESAASNGRIRVKELATGQRSRWERILGHARPDTRFDIELTDFSTGVLPSDAELATIDVERASVSRREYSLLKQFEKLPQSERFDVLLTTYGFDSIWFAQDRRYVKINNAWYQSKFRVRVHDAAQGLPTALRSPRKYEVDPVGLQGAYVEEMLVPVDITKVPYGREVASRYAGIETAGVNVPGGLIARVEEAFDRQLKPGGAFIIGDVALTTEDVPQRAEGFYVPAFRVSGVVAKYKQEDYGLAAQVLRAKGFTVLLQRVGDFVGQPDDPAHTDQVIMIVTKSRTRR